MGRRKKNLTAEWPPDALFTYMLSSSRTIEMHKNLHGKASSVVMANVCPNKFYLTTSQTIYEVGKSRYKWMDELVCLKAKEELERWDDKFADAASEAYFLGKCTFSITICIGYVLTKY